MAQHDTSHVVPAAPECDPVDVIPAGLRERKKEKTREALVRSAVRQFAELGFEHVTVEDIATDCDVSPRTFFRYFSSKEDVLFAEADGQRGRLLDALAAQPPDVPPLRALQTAVLIVAGDYEDQRETLLLRHRIVASTPALRTRASERHHSWQSAVIDQMRRSGRAGHLDELDLRLAVAAATTALQVATELWIDGDGNGDLRALLTSALDRLRNGLEH
jgi:AcrR family transcriptional regulator